MSRPGVVNLIESVPAKVSKEIFDTLVETPGFRLERIVSEGQFTPKGEWLSQTTDEWVLVLAGAAHLAFEGQDDFLPVRAGDALRIPAGLRHRVEWTDTRQKTVWLALHFESIAT